MSIFGTSMLSEINIVDFSPKGTMCAPRRKLIIELDGSQHLEQEEYDAERTAFWESKGYRVLRFWNNQVMNEIEGVLHVIYAALHDEEEGDSEDTNSKI
jgi:very-short-patch-repair endonuclease